MMLTDSCAHHGSGRMKTGPPLSEICSCGPPVQASLRTRPRHCRAQRESAAPHTSTRQCRNTCCKQRSPDWYEWRHERCCRFTECSASRRLTMLTPAASQHESFTHPVVLANELEHGDLVVLWELVLWWILCHCLIRNAPEERRHISDQLFTDSLIDHLSGSLITLPTLKQISFFKEGWRGVS